LASYPNPPEFDRVKEEVIAHFSSRGDTWAIVNLIRELDQLKTEFGSTFHYEHALAQNIIPVMKQTIRALFLHGKFVLFTNKQTSI
jgi:hypothetical protein